MSYCVYVSAVSFGNMFATANCKMQKTATEIICEVFTDIFYAIEQNKRAS